MALLGQSMAGWPGQGFGVATDGRGWVDAWVDGWVDGWVGGSGPRVLAGPAGH